QKTSEQNAETAANQKDEKGKTDREQTQAAPATKPIGRYVAAKSGPPSVVLERQHESDPWARLRPNEPGSTENYLLSLPGYRSTIYLDSGVHLTLWGNIPQFSPFPPVFESMVVLHNPSPGIDLDFTLERGRVRLANYKQPMGEAHVRVRFQHQQWDVTILNNKSDVVVEIMGMPGNGAFSNDTNHKGPTEHVGLFVKGDANLKIGENEYPLSDLSFVTWSSTNPAPTKPQTLKAVPD